MFLSDFAVNRRTTVLVFLLLIAISGTATYVYLPREADPEIVIPFITIATRYPGVSPEDIESVVTIPIERKLSGLGAVKEITSNSSEGISIITIEFEPDVDIDDALQRVGDKVDLAQGELPADAERPLVREVNTSERPIIYLSLTGSRSLSELTNIAEQLEDQLEAVPGVLDVEILGGVEREIRIEADPGRLAEYGIALSELSRVIASENVNTPAGSVDMGAAKYLTRVPGEFRTPEEVAGLVVARGAEGAVYIRNIASVREGFREMETISRVNGTPSVTLTVSKRSGENIISLSRRIHTLVEKSEESLPDGVTIHIVMDRSTEIADMVSQLESGILTGLILVLVVIFIYMGFSNALLVSLAIPLSLLITFVALFVFGITLNMVVLFSLTLCLGMLVDNAIVIVENIHRYREAGMSLDRAAKEGAGEVAIPVIASTITTLAAFSPLFFWPGVMGSYMLYLPQTVTITLVASLFVGLVVIPALVSVSRTKPRPRSRHATRGRSRSLNLYTKALMWTLRWRGVTTVFALTLFVAITVVYFAGAEIEFMPRTEPVSADVHIECPEGTNLDTSDQMVKHVEAVASRFGDDIQFVLANVGSSGQESGSVSQTHKSHVTLRFPPPPNDSMRPSEVLAGVREMLSEMVGAEFHIEQEQYGPPKRGALELQIRGEDLLMLGALSDEIREWIQQVDGLIDLDDDLERGKPEVRVAINREEARLSQLSTQEIGLAVKTAVEGLRVGEFREGDEEIDVVVHFPERFREDVSHLASMTLVNSRGEAIPISSLARIERGAGMGNIRHIDRDRTVTITGDARGRPGPEIVTDVKQLLRGFALPPGYTITFAGENEDRDLTQAFLIIAFAIGLLLIALILITQFNSIVKPMVIMSSVVLSLAGVFLGLLLFDMPFGIFMTGLGCISLAGVVVNNAIVLMDFIDREQAKGVSVHEAIVNAGRTRLRPVFLTAITTILGLLPMALGISFDFRTASWRIGEASSQFWGSMAVSIIFGLAFATLMTLFIIPVLYSLATSTHATLKSPAREATARTVAAPVSAAQR